MTEFANPQPFDSLPERSEAFEEAIAAGFPEAGYALAVSDQKHEPVATACTLCIEHASLLRAPFAIGDPNSGSAVLRRQYEELLRASWLLYATSLPHINKLARALDLAAEQGAKNLPGYLEIFEAVVKRVPEGLAAPLVEFKVLPARTRPQRIHPLHRSREGVPLEMGSTTMRISNCLMHFAYRMLASSQRRMGRVTGVYLAFPDWISGTTNSNT